MSSGTPGSVDESDHDAILAQFMGAHNVDPEEAQRWLSASSWNIGAASTAYQAHIDEEEGDDLDEEVEDGEANLGGGRTLGSSTDKSRANTQSSATTGTLAGSSRTAPSTANTGTRKKFATLGDLGSAQPQDDRADDSDDEQDLFAGGEKSGLAVQNPDDLKRKILEKARRGGTRPGGDDPAPGPSNFSGTARTLGGDDAPSQVVEDPDANVPRRPPRVERRLHFWSNGFSVDDGDLYDINDERNAQILQMIRSGRAPLDIMNVSRDQEVDVKVEQHDGPYQPPKKKANPFAGSGQRLGSPVPNVVGATAASVPISSSSATTTSSSTAHGTSAAAAAGVDLDETQPAVSIQIRLGDGTRLISRFNPSHTVGDIYAFVDRSSAESAGRPYMLMTTFPSKDLSERGTAIGEMAELKKGGAIVQKWL